MSRNSDVESLRTRAISTDAASLATITILSAIPYVARLGFYSDDWGILSDFSASAFASFLSAFPGRAVQAVYSAAQIRLFGLDPLGYHLLDTAVLACAAVLLYLLLVRLRFSRAESFTATLLLLMLPQLTTVRVWFAASQVPLSLALMLASMHFQLSLARSGKLWWLAGAVPAAVLSVGAYEIFAPLLAGFAFGLAFVRWRKSPRRRNPRAVAAGAALLALMLLAFLYKLFSSGRAGPVADPKRYILGLHQLFRFDYDWRVDSGLNIIATPEAYFLKPVEGWWTGAASVASGEAGWEITGVAVLIGAIGLWRLAGRNEERSAPRHLLLLGIAAFLLGNAIFLIVPAVTFTSTGMDNRVQVAAAIGVAIIFTALLSMGIGLLRRQHRAIAFAAVVAILGAVGFVRIAEIENYWAAAPRLQQRVLSSARVDLRDLPSNSTVILDGVCPYYGPAVVFEAPWDVGGALTLALGRPMNGDAVSPRMALTRTGLRTSIYKGPSFYPYGQSLYAYAWATHELVRLDSRVAAQRYFRDREPRHCPGYVARGVEV